MEPRVLQCAAYRTRLVRLQGSAQAFRASLAGCVEAIQRGAGFGQGRLASRKKRAAGLCRFFSLCRLTIQSRHLALQPREAIMQRLQLTKLLCLAPEPLALGLQFSRWKGRGLGFRRLVCPLGQRSRLRRLGLTLLQRFALLLAACGLLD
jgi:hypothetical protein